MSPAQFIHTNLMRYILLCIVGFIVNLIGFYGLQETYNFNRNVQTNPLHSPNLLTDLKNARVKVSSDRYIIPGDYVIHKDYGIGKYIGVKMVNIIPNRSKDRFESVVVIQYRDAIMSWFKGIIHDQLWLYAPGETGEHELSSILDVRKWNRRKNKAIENTKKMAFDLAKLINERNAIHRTPYALDNSSYYDFEQQFMYEPTYDQQICFDAIRDDMCGTRPMDRLICGDVGFGKTEVAMRAVYRAVLSNKQVAFLAPTRILALQHLRVLQSRMPHVK